MPATPRPRPSSWSLRGASAPTVGRSRGGAYLGLSGADVLHVLEYVQAHWKVDGRRIQLTGGSMGGGGIFKLGSRHPHLFSSGLITCGFTTQEPINNLLTLPLYATHSADDPVVAIITARGGSKRIPRKNLREFCGRPILHYAIDAATAAGCFEPRPCHSSLLQAYQYGRGSTNS